MQPVAFSLSRYLGCSFDIKQQQISVTVAGDLTPAFRPFGKILRMHLKKSVSVLSKRSQPATCALLKRLWNNITDRWTLNTTLKRLGVRFLVATS